MNYPHYHNGFLTHLIGDRTMAKVFAYMDNSLDFRITHENGEFKIKIESMDALDMARQFRKVSDYFKSISRDKDINKLNLSVHNSIGSLHKDNLTVINER